MLKIRFQRTGRKNDPAFRVVVVEHTAGPRAGKNVAQVGSYNPKTKQTAIDGEAVKRWMGHGAKASGTVHNLLVSRGIIEGEKVNVLPRKKPIEKEHPKPPTEEAIAADSETADAPKEKAAEPAEEKEEAKQTKEGAEEDAA